MPACPQASQLLKREHNVRDRHDGLMLSVDLLRDYPDVAEALRGRYANLLTGDIQVGGLGLGFWLGAGLGKGLG